MKNKTIKIFSLLFIVSVMLLSFGCKKNVMDATYFMEASLPFFVSVEKTKNIKEVKNALQAQIDEFENCFDTKNPNSIISQVNKAQAGEKVLINEQFVNLFNLSKQYNQLYSDFNPALYPIIKWWGLDDFPPEKVGTELNKIPTESEIEALLPFCKMDNFKVEQVDNNFYLTKTYSQSMLDFGGIAKGYFSDFAVDFLAKNGVKNGLINYAGNIMYNASKKSYIPEISVKNDVKNKLTQVDIPLTKAGVVTSGHYQRYYMHNGEIISHILTGDGKQGSKELSSVTIINENGALCDVLATVACLLKKDDAISFLNSQNVLYFIVDEHGNEIKNF